jgi:hypothetical protein
VARSDARRTGVVRRDDLWCAPDTRSRRRSSTTSSRRAAPTSAAVDRSLLPCTIRRSSCSGWIARRFARDCARVHAPRGARRARRDRRLWCARRWLGLRVGPEHRQHLTLAELVTVAREIAGATHHFRAVQLPVSLAMPEAARTPDAAARSQARAAAGSRRGAGGRGGGERAVDAGRLASGLPDEVRTLFPECATDAQRALDSPRRCRGSRRCSPGCAGRHT